MNWSSLSPLFSCQWPFLSASIDRTSTNLFCSIRSSIFNSVQFSILSNFQFCPIFNFVQFFNLSNFSFVQFLSNFQFLQFFNFYNFSISTISTILSHFQFCLAREIEIFNLVWSPALKKSIHHYFPKNFFHGLFTSRIKWGIPTCVSCLSNWCSISESNLLLKKLFFSAFWWWWIFQSHLET